MDIANMGVTDERSEDELDLGSLVRVGLELRMVQKGIQNAEIGVTKLPLVALQT